VCTEIIPEDWVVKANDAEESIIIEPEDMPEEEDDDNETDIDVLPNEHENVTF